MLFVKWTLTRSSVAIHQVIWGRRGKRGDPCGLLIPPTLSAATKWKTLCTACSLDFPFIHLFIDRASPFKMLNVHTDISKSVSGRPLLQASRVKDTLVSVLYPGSRYMFKWTFCMSECFGTNVPLHFLCCCTSLSWNFNRKRCFVLAAQCVALRGARPMRLCWISLLPSRGHATPWTKLPAFVPQPSKSLFVSLQKSCLWMMRAKTHGDTSRGRCNYIVQSAMFCVFVLAFDKQVPFNVSKLQTCLRRDVRNPLLVYLFPQARINNSLIIIIIHRLALERERVSLQYISFLIPSSLSFLLKCLISI